jgi:hypothetical protein
LEDQRSVVLVVPVPGSSSSQQQRNLFLQMHRRLCFRVIPTDCLNLQSHAFAPLLEIHENQRQLNNHCVKRKSPNYIIKNRFSDGVRRLFLNG